jgi:pimeloyl-ACP methyl ester carboxylesterase
MERIRRTRGSADYQAASGVMRDVLVAVVNESYEDQLRAVRCPVVLVWGAEDRETGVAIGRAAREILEAAGTEVTLQVVPGVGHHTPLEAPGVLRAAIGVQP